MDNKEDIRYIYKYVSERIKLFRKYRGITQEQLADMTTFSKGLIGTFSLAVLYCFSRALDIPIELFVKEDITEDLKKLNIKTK